MLKYIKPQLYIKLSIKKKYIKPQLAIFYLRIHPCDFSINQTLAIIFLRSNFRVLGQSSLPSDVAGVGIIQHMLKNFKYCLICASI